MPTSSDRLPLVSVPVINLHRRHEQLPATTLVMSVKFTPLLPHVSSIAARSVPFAGSIVSGPPKSPFVPHFARQDEDRLPLSGSATPMTTNSN